MKLLLVAFMSSVFFGLGLSISGMTLPSKVQGFLDITGEWDPSLLSVMFGAILVHSISYRWITRRESPILVKRFQIPSRRDIDWQLILGSAIFGVGWGLGGFCPGPALVGLVSGQKPVVVFVLSMIGGIYAHKFFSAKILVKRKGAHYGH